MQGMLVIAEAEVGNCVRGKSKLERLKYQATKGRALKTRKLE